MSAPRVQVVRQGVRLASRGLPARLPPGERLLWQGSPAWDVLLRRTFHAGVVTLYFAAIIAASAITAASHGANAHQLAISVFHRAALACVPLALIALYAWSVQRTTIYSITNHRVVVSCGIALPMSFNLPFSHMQAAGLRLYRGGAGDINLRLEKSDALMYFAIWPHARPWRMARTEPMLRCVPDAERVSAILSGALQEHAGQGADNGQAQAVPAPAGRETRPSNAPLPGLRAGAVAA